MMQLPKQPHVRTFGECLNLLETDPDRGLNEAVVQKRRAQFGPNVLERSARVSWIGILARQFLNPVIFVLAFAMALAFTVGDWLEGIAVVVVILVTVLIGFIMEWQAIRSLTALEKWAESEIKVLRAGKVQRLKASVLVPGDIILPEMGDVIPADARIISQENFGIKESALTGESMQVSKIDAPLPEDTVLAERRNMLYRGTLVSRGAGKAVVVATGKYTELGKVGALTSRAEKTDSPFQKQLTLLGNRLIVLTLILALLITLVGYLQGRDIVLMIKTALALGVAAIPEGLPIVATIALARGMLRLAKRRVIVKQLEAVQTLGEVEIICTDKTGTLTEDQMTVEACLTGNGADVPQSEWRIDSNPQSLFPLIRAGVLCNNVALEEQPRRGDALEVALLHFAEQAGAGPATIKNDYPEILEIPFDTETKMMATLNRSPEGFVVNVKGAVEVVLGLCEHFWGEGGPEPLDEARRKAILRSADGLASRGLRLLGFGMRETSGQPTENELLQELTFLGVLGFLDPPRTDVSQAIEVCKKAGIKVVMVTGDHPVTAEYIAREVGILEAEDQDAVLHGKDLPELETADEPTLQSLLGVKVFARVTPEQKLNLIRLYQEAGHSVGMTGDGINDAPALKTADIGIAMGQRGTEAAKEVANMILQDDRFNAIELAIRQGRAIFENIRKFVVYLLSCNLAEVISVSLAALLGMPLPLLPLQILFLNLITDVFPALAIGMGEADRGIMDRSPRAPDTPIIPLRLWRTTLVFGMAITAGVLGLVWFAEYRLQLPYEQVNTMAFYTLALSQLIHVFNLPARNLSFFRNAITANPWIWGALALCILLTAAGYLILPLREALSLAPLSPAQYGWVAAFAFGSLLLIQVLKRLKVAV